MRKVLSNKNYQIVPFIFKENIDEILKIYKNDKEIQKNWIRPKKTSAEYLLTYVNNLISNNDKEKGRIGIVFELDIRKSNYEKLGITKETKAKKVLQYGDKKYDFNYNFIKIYLFESNVGFLVYSLNFDENIENIINGNNAFKKYNHSIASESYEKIIKNQEDKIEFEKNKRKINNEAIDYQNKVLQNLKNIENDLKSKKRSKLVKELIETLGINVTNFFTNTNEPDYSHIFTYLRLPKESTEEEIKKYLFQLKGGVNESCKPTLKELDLENGDGNIHLYENYWWGTSIEAITCICKDTDDEKANGFNASFVGTIQDVYLYIYIIMLHMRYGLLRYIIEASKLSKNVTEVKGKNCEDIERLNKLQKEIIQFDFRGIFNEISNMSAHIRISDMIKEKLRIQSLNNELQAEIDNLNKLIGIYTEKIENKHKNKIERIFQILAIILASLALSTFVRDTIDCLGGINDGSLSMYYSLVFILPILVVIISLTIIFIYNKLIRK